ncbi:MAG TPA: hypothetical protein VGU45_06640 [Microvirga sp.]|jgi:hypothetical protein|nr:hypothetical protein [Microvirga sp.]
MVGHPRFSLHDGRYGPLTLAGYPEVVVRVECPWCPHRRGRYRLARLAARFGADITLDDLLHALSAGCPFRRGAWERPPGKYEPKCGVRLPDLEDRFMRGQMPPVEAGGGGA